MDSIQLRFEAKEEEFEEDGAGRLAAFFFLFPEAEDRIDTLARVDVAEVQTVVDAGFCCTE